MVVCLCRAVSDRAIRDAIAAGACTVRSLRDMCGAGGDCGACCAMLAALVTEADGGVCHGAARSPYLRGGGLE